MDNESLKKLGVELSEDLPTYDVPVSLIEPNNWNSNEMDDDSFNRLVQEMEETGMIDPIQIAPKAGGKNFVIIDGENRWSGAVVLGREKIPCNILLHEKFADPDLRQFLTVRKNVLRGKQNPEKFQKMYKEMLKKYGDEQLQHLFGYTSSDAWKKLTKGVEESLVKSGVSKTMAKEFRRGAKKAKSVDALGSILNKLFRKYGSDLPHSFMVFTYGGKEHLYIVMNSRMMSIMEKIKDACREKDLDINDVMASAIEGIPAKIKGIIS